MLELYSLVSLHGVMLNLLSTGTTLPFFILDLWWTNDDIGGMFIVPIDAPVSASLSAIGLATR
jgi:hypothetical protein